MRDLGFGLVYLQWNGCKVTLVSLGFLVVDYRDSGVWAMLDKSIYHGIFVFVTNSLPLKIQSSPRKAVPVAVNNQKNYCRPKKHPQLLHTLPTSPSST